MIVKRYTGNTETEAVMKAKEDLGPNAVVLNMRNMKQRGLARLFKKDYVEITAALEERDFAQNINSRKPTAAPKTEPQRIDLSAGDDTAPQKDAILEKKLDSLHDMLKNQISREEEAKEVKEQKEEPKLSVSGENNVNFKSLRLIYNKLLENEVDEKYANAIINDIESSLKKESTLDSILSSVYQKIILKLGEPDCIADDDRKKVVVFIGPTGVGKTTTIAKIASNFKLVNKKKVAMITADTYRIAAVDQLNTYASILDVPVSVIYTPGEVCEAVKEMDDYQMIFIDTAGRSHKNEEQRNEVLEMVNNLKEMEGDFDLVVFLVLSVTIKYRDIVSICDAYKDIENFRLLFTKLDETGSLGNILNIRMYTNAPLSYTTFGQNVPDDINTADVQKLAKNLLGGE